MVDTKDEESDDDVGDELPAETYKDACLAFETLKSFSSERNNIEAPTICFHAWMINL